MRLEDFRVKFWDNKQQLFISKRALIKHVSYDFPCASISLESPVGLLDLTAVKPFQC